MSRSRRAPPTSFAARRVGEMLRFDDPAGHAVEVFCGAALEPRPAVSPYGTQFVTGDMGLQRARRAAVVPGAADAALAFYTDVLGFRLRDSMRICRPSSSAGSRATRPSGSGSLACCPRHHSLQRWRRSPAEGSKHRPPDDRGGRAGRASAGPLTAAARRGAPGVGVAQRRHTLPTTSMVSFYVGTPGGFDIEYGTDGRLVDDATWVSRETTAVSLWGHSFAGPATP